MFIIWQLLNLISHLSPPYNLHFNSSPACLIPAHCSFCSLLQVHPLEGTLPSSLAVACCLFFSATFLLNPCWFSLTVVILPFLQYRCFFFLTSFSLNLVQYHLYFNVLDYMFHEGVITFVTHAEPKGSSLVHQGVLASIYCMEWNERQLGIGKWVHSSSNTRNHTSSFIECPLHVGHNSQHWNIRRHM